MVWSDLEIEWIKRYAADAVARALAASAPSREAPENRYPPYGPQDDGEPNPWSVTEFPDLTDEERAAAAAPSTPVAAEEIDHESSRTLNALKIASMAIDDWLNTYASEFCADARVQEAHSRIDQYGGTVAYIAEVQFHVRSAMETLTSSGRSQACSGHSTDRSGHSEGVAAEETGHGS